MRFPSPSSITWTPVGKADDSVYVNLKVLGTIPSPNSFWGIDIVVIVPFAPDPVGKNRFCSKVDCK